MSTTRQGTSKGGDTMKSIIESGLSLEEIYLICQCNASEKEGILNELNGYLDNLGKENDGMSELVLKTMGKVKLLSPEGIEKIKMYPIEETEN